MTTHPFCSWCRRRWLWPWQRGDRHERRHERLGAAFRALLRERMPEEFDDDHNN